MGSAIDMADPVQYYSSQIKLMTAARPSLLARAKGPAIG